MSSATGRSRWARPRISSIAPLRAAAECFCPPYGVAREDRSRLRITLEDPEGIRPRLTLRHRGERRLFLRANYLSAEADVPGAGPSQDGMLSFRFRGPLKRQRASLRWRRPVDGGEAWARRLEAPLLRGARQVQAIERLEIHWDASRRVWRLWLETLSGSMLGGFMSPMPIAVPFDPAEAVGIMAMMDVLAETGRASTG
jgi:hypothetical protein